MPIDLLVIGSHPDDIELTCSGTIAKLIRQRRSVVLLDLTEGELGTRGTREIRRKEAEEAARILGVTERRNLGIPDGNVEVSRDNLAKLISVIRELQPKLLLIPHSRDRHPDHVHSHQLCKEAWFYSGLKKFDAEATIGGLKEFRPDACFEYMQWFEFQPSFIVDVTETYETKLKAIAAYSSQFHNPASKEPETKLSRPQFLEMVETRSKYYGQRIGVKYGEPFYYEGSIGVDGFFELKIDRR